MHTNPSAACHIRLPCVGGTAAITGQSGTTGGPCWNTASMYDGVWSTSNKECVQCTGAKKTKLQLRPFVGKWNDESCLEFWREVSKRFVPATAKYRFNVCTDGNKQNATALQTVFANGAVNYAKVKKIRKGDIVIGVVKKNVLGYMPITQIGIHHVDGYCKRLRERVSRYGRRSATFSKNKTPFYHHLCIFQAYNNFIEIYKEKKTPCMIEGITAQKWDWDDIL